MKTWRVILETIRYVPKLWFINLIGITLIFFAWQAPAFLLREFIDLISGEATVHFQSVWTIVALFGMLAIGKIGSVVTTISSSIPVMFRIAGLLHKNMLSRILKQPGAQALPNSPGEAISRFRGDVDTIRGFPMTLNDLVAALVSGIVAAVVMIKINWFITIVAFLPLIAIVILVNIASRKLEELRRASREAAGSVTGFIAELFGAVQAVKVASAEDQVIDYFRTLNDKRCRTALRDRLFDELLDVIFFNALNLGTGVILILAAQPIQAGTFTVGDLVLFMYLLDFVAELSWMIGRTLAKYKQTGVSVDRVIKIMKNASAEELVKHGEIYAKGDLPEIPFPKKIDADRLQTLTISDLSYRFPNSENGIEKINLEIKRGSFTVITGRIGSGKTTLLRVILGLLPRDSGEIIWNGELISDPADFFVFPRTAYTPQVPWLFSGSLRDNILMGIPDEKIDLDHAVKSAVMDLDLEDLEEGFETIIGPKGVRISGGQAQRTAAARMFVREPELLVFDDLSSALDVETEQKLWARVFDRENATCLVVSHRHAALDRADQIIVLKDGDLHAHGKLEDLLDRNEEMKRLWRGEFDSD